MKRTLEAELMNDPAQADAYAGDDLENAYWLFMQCLQKFFPELTPEGAILDLGCGPAAIPIRLAERFPNCEIYGVDGAIQMLAQAKKSVSRAKMEDRVHLIHGTLPDRVSLPHKRYEVIISNSFLHHLADPVILWNALRDYGKLYAAVLVVDLIRPETEEQLQSVIDKVMPNALPLLRKDMAHSLRAAFTMDELTAQLQESDLLGQLVLTKVTPFQFAVHGRLFNKHY